jgi:hypothetical protein
MFTHEQLHRFINSKENTLIATPDSKYALYKFNGDRIEVRLDEKFHREADGRNRKSIGYMETILRMYLTPEQNVFDTYYRLLRNCLLIERVQ